MKIEPRTLKGFRDFLPNEMRKRQYVIDILKRVFESYGFEPLETPALEYAEILTGKYGDEGDKLMYKFKDNGDRDVALRYDQTVPLARVVAQYKDKLPLPFKRYQIQNVWRADNTQKGRFREFLQCDIDIVGTKNKSAEVELIKIIDECLKKLDFGKYTINLNSRELLFKKISEVGIDDSLKSKVITIIDKIDKTGWKQMDKELLDLGIPRDKVNTLNGALSVTQSIEQDPYLDGILQKCKELGITSVQSKLYLARGLDYYTGLIVEVEVEGYSGGSIGGGGRYDNLIGTFSDKQIPAVGFSFGFDRIIEAMEEMNLFPDDLITSKVLVLNLPNLEEKAFEIATKLRDKGINTEVYLGSNTEKGKQFSYAEKKGIPYTIIPLENDSFELGQKDKNTGEITKTSGTIDQLLEQLNK